jgi:5S rRNA maturation endonuclease (ribonuclease M5)
MTAALPPIAMIAELLDGDVSGAQVLCPGPGHGAGDRSLSVKPDSADREGFVIHSFAGDDWKECRAHVRKKLSLPEPDSKKTNGGKSAWTVLGEYVYLDENGERFLKVRKCRDGAGGKQYPQYHWDGNGWAKGKPDSPKIPYRLPELIAAPAAVVYFVEGEKDADNLARIGFVATTASEGANAKWESGLTPFFKERHVVILPDADRPGRAHAQKVAKAIHGVAASVKIVDLYPDRHDGSDVSVWIAKDSAGVRLAKEVKEAPLWGPSGPAPSVAADGAELLSDVYAVLGRFVAYPSDHARVAHTLWIAHTHAMEAWDSTPRIAFLSPEPGSGKTRALEVSEILVPNPVEAVNVSPAYLFRKVGAEEGPPTILYDEIDTVFGPKAKDNEEIRGLLNAGHRRGAVAGRCVVRGKIVETEEIPAYCAVALAGLGWLPDTLMSRSIVIRMRRRSPSETIEPYRRRDEIDEGHELRGRLAGWAAAKAKILYAARPAMPAGIEDRNADVWEALFAVADTAGGDWPKLAREAAVALVAAGREEEPSLGIRLLGDLRTIFGKAEALFTKTILDGLHELEEAPWKDLKGKGLDSRGLALRLRQYGIRRKQVREGKQTSKGYTRADLADAWDRYLPPESPGKETRETRETSEQYQGPHVSDVSDSPTNVSPDASDEARSVSDSFHDVSPGSLNGGPKSPTKSGSVSDVSDVSHLAEKERRTFEAVDGGDSGEDRTCVQCRGNIDGTERRVAVSGHPAVWLHLECERFWVRGLKEREHAPKGSQ